MRVKTKSFVQTPLYSLLVQQYLQIVEGKEVVFIPHKHSDELIVVFSTRNQNYYMGLAMHYKRRKTNLLFIKNPENNFYLENDYGESYSKVLNYFVKNFTPEKVSFLGSSMSAYGAIFHGVRFNVNVIANLPQIDLFSIEKTDSNLWKSTISYFNQIKHKELQLQKWLVNNIKDSVIYTNHSTSPLDYASYKSLVSDKKIVTLIRKKQIRVNFLSYKSGHKWYLGSIKSVIRLHKALQKNRAFISSKKSKIWWLLQSFKYWLKS